MKTIKFFHSEETFNYQIEKALCKVVFQGNKKCLLVEIHSNDDLEQVEGDSLQNDYPQLSLFIDDFPLDVESVEELNGKKEKSESVVEKKVEGPKETVEEKVEEVQEEEKQVKKSAKK